MKTTTAIISAAFAILALPALAETAGIPTGTLSVDRNMVRLGVAPHLTWNIKYPTKVTDVVTLPPDGTINPKTKLRVKISMIGVGITNQLGIQYSSMSHMKFGSSSWSHLFTGKGRNVRPGDILIDKVVNRNETLRFRSKVALPGYNYYYNNSQNIQVLKDGDTPPTTAAGYSHQTSVAEYLRPYVKDGKIKLGPMDVIYVAELTHSNPSHFGYDRQDTIVLVQFEEITQ